MAAFSSSSKSLLIKQLEKPAGEAYLTKALQLLALESVYPAAGQLAVDMLKRLSFSNEEVVEVLLLKNKLIEALRFCQMRPHLLHQSQQDGLSQRFLELAAQSEDRMTFYNVFRFFQLFDRNGSFLKEADYEPLMRKFLDTFGEVPPS